MIETIATLILSVIPVIIAYYYGKQVGERKGEVQSLIKAGRYPKRFIDEN